MNWTEAEIYTSTEGADIICASLLDIGIKGFSIKDSEDFNEFLKNKDNKRRDKRKCIYYEKINKICNLLKARCPGSSHCKSYHEKEEK